MSLLAFVSVGTGSLLTGVSDVAVPSSIRIEPVITDQDRRGGLRTVLGLALPNYFLPDLLHHNCLKTGSDDDNNAIITL